MKKFLALFSAMLIALTAFTGCKTPDTGDLLEFKNRPNEVVVYYSYNAYGKNWITEIAEKYMTEHNDDTYINLKKSLDAGNDLAKVESGVAVGDLYILDCHLEGKIAYYEDISDVYDSYPIGESEKKIIEKVSSTSYDYYKNSGAQNFVMPKGGGGTGTNFVYNKTLLDQLYPNGYTLPRTTDEFAEMGNYLKENTNYYLLTASIGDGDSGDYVYYMHKAWFAQLIGLEAYEQFLQGRYYDATSQKWLFDQSAPTVYSKQKEALKDYYEILEKIYKKANGYLQPDSGVLGQSTAQALLAGIPYGDYNTGIFMAQGAYVEQEMGWMLAESESSGNAQELRMMQMPVASEIIKRTPSIANDVALRAVIDYVDKILIGENADKPVGVTDADIEIIKEARSTFGTYMAGGMIIPKAASNKEGAKDFIRYLASDEAAIIASKNANGINLLPFGKQVSDEELGFERSEFMKDVQIIAKRSKNVVSSDSQEFLFSYVADFNPLPDARVLIRSLCNATNTTDTAESVYNANYKNYNGNWSYMVTSYLNRGGNVEN